MCVKDTATAANDTLDMTCPRAWQNATGVSSAKSSLLIGWLQGKTMSLVQAIMHVPGEEKIVHAEIETYSTFW